MDVLNRASRAIVRQPEVTAALVTALSAADPMVIECQRETSAITDEVLSLALPEIDEVTRLRIIRVLGHVWYSALVGWVNGWSGIDDIPAELELAAHLLLDHRAEGSPEPVLGADQCWVTTLWPSSRWLGGRRLRWLARGLPSTGRGACACRACRLGRGGARG